MTTVSPAGRMPEPQEPHAVSIPLPHHAVNYYLIFVTLVALTIVTVAIALVRFQSELVNVLVALIIASIKATFVARYFMHLKFEGKLIFLILMVPVTLCIILICALIPDIGLGRHTAFNDFIGMFERIVRQ